MLQNITRLRIRYSETDQMGFVYYGNYAQFFEIGRVELLREVGISYKSLEDRGYLLPVKELHINYHHAAKYDDEISIHTEVREIPSNRIQFFYKIELEGKLLVDGSATLFFMNEDKRACRPPKWFIDHLKPFFKAKN